MQEKNIPALGSLLAGINEVIYITASSGKEICKCPYCGAESASVHSTYQRIFQDLPIQGHNVNVILNYFKNRNR